MNADHPLTVNTVEIWPIDVPLTDPFVVATGEMRNAQNVFVRVTLQNGICGYGEMAPFPDITGEDREASQVQAKELAMVTLGQAVLHFRRLANVYQEMAPAHPAARCGLETALVDALCRAGGMPLWGLWGGADVRARDTDITIPITSLDRSLVLVREWYAQGFRVFKMKVGSDIDLDVRRLEAIHRTFRNVSFVVDSNQGFSRSEAEAFAKGVKSFGGTILLFEQPVAKHDLASLAALRTTSNIPIAVDESVQTVEELKAVIQHKAADIVNIKITKSGLVHAGEIARVARSAGLGLMIGGMVETRVTMGCSFSLVLGLGDFSVLDLDTPLLLAQDPVKGGYQYVGSEMQPWNASGLGMEVAPMGSCIRFER